MPRGGKREGAGRKPKPKLPTASRSAAHSVLNHLGSVFGNTKLPTEDQMWIALLAAQDQRLRFDVLKYLTDRRDGKPVTRISGELEHSGEIQTRIIERLQEGRKRVAIAG